MRSSRLRAVVLAVVASVLLLSGCGVAIDTSGAERVDGDGVPSTINADKLAVVAEGVILQQGFTVTVDCGTEDVPFVVGTTLECEAVDQETQTSGAYTVTIRAIEGADYEIQVLGADSEPSPQPEPIFESVEAFNQLTAEALAASLGETPVVDCGPFDIELFAGNEVVCGYSTSTVDGTVISTVTSFDGSSYEISVVEE